MRKFSRFTIGAVFGLVFAATPLVAVDKRAVLSDAWAALSPDLSVFPAPQSVQVQVPSKVSASRNAEVTLLVGSPYSCFKTEVRVTHRDEYTHVLTPVLMPGNQSCVPISRYDVQKVSLGYLQPGEHEVLIPNAIKPVKPARFKVADGDELATH